MLDQVVTMIGGPAFRLDLNVVDQAREALFRLGAEVGRPDWLAEDQACDLAFSDLNADQAEAAIRRIVAELPVDIVAQPVASRRKHLLLADMESTLIRNEMLDELADIAGRGAEIAAVTASAMNGEIDFEQALASRVALLAGLPVEVLEQAAARIEIMPGAAPLVATMRRSGGHTVLISGGFHVFADRVRQQLGLDEAFANTLVMAEDRLTGAVGQPILGRDAKYERLIQCTTEMKLPLSATLAVGDGANDLRMIEAAGLGIAYHAKPYVRARTRWRIDYADLTALLFAQGYRAEEFVGTN